MVSPLLELEGIWEEIKAQIPDFFGQRVRILVYPAAEHETLPLDPRPIDELLAEIAAMPAEEIAKLPPDLSDPLDHYIYGTPKRA
jgi:hypothetical protein